MSKVAIVKATKDIIRPDFIGSGATEYCLKNGLMHTAFYKDDLFVMSVERYENFWKAHTNGNFSKAFEEGGFSSSTDAVQLAELKLMAKKHNWEESITLAEAIKRRSLYIQQPPRTDELAFIRIIDGSVLLKDSQDIIIED